VACVKSGMTAHSLTESSVSAEMLEMNHIISSHYHHFHYQ